MNCFLRTGFTFLVLRSYEFLFFTSFVLTGLIPFFVRDRYGISGGNYGHDFTSYGTGGYSSVAMSPSSKPTMASHAQAREASNSPINNLPNLTSDLHVKPKYQPLPSGLLPPAKPPIVGQLGGNDFKSANKKLAPLGKSPSDPRYLMEAHDPNFLRDTNDSRQASHIPSQVPTTTSNGYSQGNNSNAGSRLGTGASYRRTSNPKGRGGSRQNSSHSNLRNAGAAIMGGSRSAGGLDTYQAYGTPQRRRVGA